MEHNVEDFSDWYKTRHGYAPFPWQARLAARVAVGDWPDALTPPTGSGKTAIIDIWLWARIQGYPMPRRLVYVIDRRLVVDSVSIYAESLAASLPEEQRPAVIAMRGGITIDHDWVLEPLRPAIIISTVDQAGSRLLFSGYGVSPKTAPIHAGLLGNDALFVLDEVHLAQPFLQTLSSIAERRGNRIPLPWRVLVMSATWERGKRHGLDRDDHAHPVLSQRLNAGKPATLVKITKTADLSERLAREAEACRKAGADVVAVVCNRVARARAIFEQLRKHGDAVLLTGRIRPYDKQELIAEYLPRIAVGSRGQRDPLYVVATQTIEVGADLDVDALVTESAPLSALRQRAGRLNRLGELKTAPMVIVHQPVKKDPVYGEGIDKAGKWLFSVASGKPKSVDFGITAMEKLFTQKTPPEEDEALAPALLDAHVDMLSQTSVPHGIDVTPWLHGWQTNIPDVYLCWRMDWSPESVQTAPPVKHELLAIPLYAFRRWTGDISDVNGGMEDAYWNDKNLPCIRWDGEIAQLTNSAKIKAGDTVVLESSIGGCDRYGWSPQSSQAVEDIGDTERRVRLHPLIQPKYADKISQLLADEETTAGEWRDLARLVGLASPGRVLVYPGGVVVLSQVEWTSQSAYKPIDLRDHQQAVAKRAEELASGSDLPVDLVEAVRRAGAGHDTGKRDPRWQAWVGGDGQTPLAKGPGGDNPYLTLPRGWRHEMASAVHQKEPLVRHLVGSHHGNGRPTFPAAPELELWHQLSDWPTQFMQLQKEFGPWGLAYLETLVRLADWTISAEEQR